MAVKFCVCIDIVCFWFASELGWGDADLRVSPNPFDFSRISTCVDDQDSFLFQEPDGGPDGLSIFPVCFDRYDVLAVEKCEFVGSHDRLRFSVSATWGFLLGANRHSLALMREGRVVVKPLSVEAD